MKTNITKESARFIHIHGILEEVMDLPQEDGSRNLWIVTEDGHSYGPFSTPAQARTWAKKEQIMLSRGKPVSRRHVLTG